MRTQVMEKPLDDRVKTQQVSRPQALLEQLWDVARAYVTEARLVKAALKYDHGAIVLTNAPYVGRVPLCAIQDGEVVRYF